MLKLKNEKRELNSLAKATTDASTLELNSHPMHPLGKRKKATDTVLEQANFGSKLDCSGISELWFRNHRNTGSNEPLE